MAQHKLLMAKGNCGIRSREGWAEPPRAPERWAEPPRAPESWTEPPHAWILRAQGGSSLEKMRKKIEKKGLWVECLLNMHNGLSFIPSTTGMWQHTL